MIMIMLMVLATAFVVSAAATFGRASNDIEYRKERDYKVAYTWEAALSMVDATSSAANLGPLPASIAFSLNGVTGTLTVANNSANMANSLLVTTTFTTPDGSTYPESGILSTYAGWLSGSYWYTNGTTVNSNYDAWSWLMSNPSPTGTFNGALLNYTGMPTTPVVTWLSTDSNSYTGTNNNLSDGVVLLNGYITTMSANTIIKATSVYGSYVSIDGDNYVINNGPSSSLKSGTVTIPTAGTYPIFAYYYSYPSSTATFADFELQWSTNGGGTYSSIPTSSIIPSTQQWVFNGSAVAYGNGAELVNGGLNQAGSAWLTIPVKCDNFHGSFDFQFAGAVADGFTFTIQNVGTSALGSNGYGLGIQGVGNSISLTFQLVNPTDYWNLTDDGIILTSDGNALSSYSLNLASGDLFHCSMTQSNGAFTATLTDQYTGKSVVGVQSGWTPSSYLGSSTGYMGFTASTGATASTVYVTNLNFGP